MAEKESDTTTTTVEFELATISPEKGTALPATNDARNFYPEPYSPDGKGAGKLQVSATPAFDGIGWIKLWQRLELGVLVAAILVVWVLLSLPIVFYHLPSDGDDTSGCVIYNITNGLCIEALQEIQTCIMNGQSDSNTSEIYVSAGDFTQEEIEDIVLIGTSLASSPECEQVLVPFLCQFFYVPCDDNGESYPPSYNECRVITTEICPTAWDLAATLLGDSLPSCDALPQTSLSCNGTSGLDNMPSSGDNMPSSGDNMPSSGDDMTSSGDDMTSSGSGDPAIVQPTSNSTECAVYTGQACKEALLGIQNCLTDRIGSDDVYIPFDVDQVEIESEASSTVGGLEAFAGSECKERAIPFLCVYYFGLCDSSGVEYQSSREECISVSTGVCQTEWSLANQFLPGQLPTCDSLLEGSIPCAQGTLAVVESIDPDMDPGGEPDMDSGADPDMDSQPSSSDNCTSSGRACRDAFYCESGICLPRCDKWEQYPHSTIVAADVTMTLSAAIGLISGIAVLVLSLIRRKQVFTFPSVTIVYQTLSMLVLLFVVLISYTDRSELYCSSRDLIESIDDPTPFCIFSGIVFYYVLLQLAILWFVHVVVLFWKLRFPFHARSFGTARRLAFIHVATILIAIWGPLTPVIAALAGDGFGLTRFPPILCTGTEGDPTFYALVLPVIVLLQIGISLLIIIFWVIHKQHGLFRAKLSKTPLKIGTAERKILILFCYYVVLGVVALTSFTLMTRNVEELTDEITKYFICEATGVNENDPCDRSGFEDLGIPVLPVVSYILLGLFPAVNLIFAINVTELKQMCGRKRKHHIQSNGSSSGWTATSSVKRMDSCH